ncbi:zinc-binding dehydrogenase [Pelagibius litoralis]|uniref:Zinc-binding dehydrogenase n=1 Tax=Pelagibius litoralis TaxID=374515 RepID=A0A967C3J7_9PROT|nr:zinc-binding dehydrogenase [Pelagibius litoralis]NIA67885.1 zinc-binding dehydrogenase [Pelagibius litoralis]
MKAAVIEKQGGLEGLVYRDWPDPVAGAGELVVRVHACGLNHLDIFVRRGMPGFPVPLPFISGGDIAGEVAEIGDGVSGFALGDRVLINPSTPKGMLGEQLPGGMAQKVAVPADHAIMIPDAVSYREAACLPVAYGTAQRMLVSRGKLQSGETILVLGASGGVGNACVQIARNLGATVIAAAGDADKLERLRELGADHLINYKEQDFSAETWRITGKRGVDVAVNFTGGDSWAPSLRCLRKNGRLLTCGATAGFDPKTDIRYIWVRELNILGSDGWSTEDIRIMLDGVRRGSIKPVISKVLPLEQAREAEALIEDRSVFGKVILEP